MSIPQKDGDKLLPKLKKYNPGDSGPLIRLYPIRFAVAITFGLCAFFNQYNITIFAGIQEASSTFFNVSQSLINWLGLTYPVLYLPGTILSAWMFKRYELRKSFIFASILMFISSILRYASVNQRLMCSLNLCDSDKSSSSIPYPYCIQFIGSSLLAIVQPFYTNSASRVAAEWFSVDGRDIVTAIFVCICPVGFGLGVYFPTLFVHSTGNGEYDSSYGGFAACLGSQVIALAICLILTLIFFKNKPPLPPSMSQRLKLIDYNMTDEYDDDEYDEYDSDDDINDDPDIQCEIIEANTTASRDGALQEPLAARAEEISKKKSGLIKNQKKNNKNRKKQKKKKKKKRKNTRDHDNNNNKQHLQEIAQQVGTVLMNKEFVMLVIAFGLCLGLLSAICTLINQYTAAFGYSSDDAGLFGLFLTLGGAIGTITGGILTEKTKAFNKILKCCMILSYIIIAIICCSQLKENNKISLYILFCLYGFVTYPLISVAVEAGAECTYPIDEDISNTVLIVSASTFILILVEIWNSFLPIKGESYHNNTWNGSTLYLMTSYAIALILVLLYNGKYNRLMVEITSEIHH